MVANDSQNKDLHHEAVILLHLVQMVKVVRKIPDETLAERLGVDRGEVVQMFSESSRPTLELLRRLFLAVEMETDGVFETLPGHPERTALVAEGFGNAIERGLQILNEEAPEAEKGTARSGSFP
jgi:hypothetical protein